MMTSTIPHRSAKIDILFVISGSIAAYKALDVLRELKRRDLSTSVVLSKNAPNFVTELSVAALTEQHPRHAFFSTDSEAKMSHISLARAASVRCVCPASASMIARFAMGMCDDLATTCLITANRPVIFFPAMNPEMWANPLVQRNVSLLREHGHIVVEPARGETACGEEGAGRLPDIEMIVDCLHHHVCLSKELEGCRVLVTAGPTQEPIDAVRSMTNKSEGIQGYAIARELSNRGADVILVSGASKLAVPYGVKGVRIMTGRELWRATQDHLPVDIAICCAAVADWYTEPQDGKIKKSSGFTVDWHENPDTLANLGHGQDAKGRSVARPKLVIGFAAESQNLQTNASKKTVSKNADWLLANSVARGGFGDVHNSILFLKRDQNGGVTDKVWPMQSKSDIAKQLVLQIIDWVGN